MPSGIYEYDIATGTTTTITTDGKFAAASPDGSHVYYVIGRRTIRSRAVRLG